MVYKLIIQVRNYTRIHLLRKASMLPRNLVIYIKDDPSTLVSTSHDDRSGMLGEGVGSSLNVRADRYGYDRSIGDP